jgi:hypothetical protein
VAIDGRRVSFNALLLLFVALAATLSRVSAYLLTCRNLELQGSLAFARIVARRLGNRRI